MFLRCAAVAIALIFVSTIASADKLPLGCYTNTYSKVHLDKHKGQSVTSFKMTITDARKLENSSAVLIAEFDVLLRGKDKTKWSEAAYCNGKPGAWTCQIDCDGGGFELSENANGLTVRNTRGFRVAKDGGCGEETDAIEAKPGNRMFRLSKAELSACK